MQQRLRRWLFYLLLVVLVLALDQTAKWWVINNLALGESFDLIPQISQFIRVTRSFNTGAAFGIFPMASNLILILALVTITAFIISYPSIPAQARLSRLGIGLITGGALSNAIDRIRFGQVVDYVHVQLTPTFSNISNFADHAVTIGVAILLIEQWIMERQEHRQRVEQEAMEMLEGMAYALAGAPPFDEETSDNHHSAPADTSPDEDAPVSMLADTPALQAKDLPEGRVP